ncbi:biogenesis of lysosome-related organelles complex 1 subunit 1 [Juglans regia]|uniref:Biogenesis of lysosome-related organelles complex 1 subunit 1 n=1 Tax=Juglans regia TaxID=51240 RepID=A0A2I4FAC7_JUGRE|nr:biogenesis of lysosome-related organelles complex 1 subunit 1 [Juglans regia]XP_018828602.1 biogenesis of lysosome-related organelles complex 1 subunit 1 [Juglans regia]XP_018828604.1 biogenesis of lysosome-related organelles complex 1 subunit 1 [Juglans regia]XP_018828605.1 biogenesis of lysosome-related organelles complex 1 subunit 1 [Juglans regia]
MYSPQLPLARTRVPYSSSSSETPNADPGGLEASLLQFIHHHHEASLGLREHTERAKKDAIRNAARVSDLLVDAVNGGVQEAFVNQKRIELEIRALAATIARFMKQTDHWLTATHAINTAIKEIGDFENWMKTMEFDCKSVSAAIHNIHQA